MKGKERFPVAWIISQLLLALLVAVVYFLFWAGYNR